MNLDKQINIERKTTVQDNTGQQKDVWVSVCTVWASIRPISSRQYYAASGDRAEITHEIIMRHGPQIRPRDRITYDGRIFDVQVPVNVDERDRYLNCRTIEHA
jgi:SPP1 family predicted phage head-tail adaptor